MAHVRAHVPELTVDSGGVAARTWELSEFLVDRLEVTEVGSGFVGSLTYHPTCPRFGCWRWGSGRSPCCRRCPVRTRPLDERRSAAASAGRFAIKNAQVSSAMLADKLRRVEETGASAVCACDASCLLHIRGGLERRGSAGARRAPGRGARLVRAAASRSALPVSFEEAAPAALEDAQTRAGRAARDDLDPRQAGSGRIRGDGLGGLAWPEAIRDSALARLDELLVVLEGAVTSAGGEVHWAADAARPNEIVVRLVSATGAREVVKVKSRRPTRSASTTCSARPGSRRSRPTWPS